MPEPSKFDWRYILGSILGDVTIGAILKKYMDTHGTEHVQKIIKFKFTAEHRAKLRDYIEQMGHEEARRGIKEWYKRAHEQNKKHPGAEDRWVRLLGELLYHCDSLGLNTELIFNTLGCLPKEEQEEALYFLEQDWFSQLAKRIKLALKKIIPSKKTLRELDNNLEPLVHGLRNARGGSEYRRKHHGFFGLFR